MGDCERQDAMARCPNYFRRVLARQIELDVIFCDYFATCVLLYCSDRVRRAYCEFELTNTNRNPTNKTVDKKSRFLMVLLRSDRVY